METTLNRPLDELDDILTEPIDYGRYCDWARKEFKDMPLERQDKLCFIMFMITKFAKTYKMKRPNAVRYLRKYGGWEYLFEHWWVLHTEDALEAVRDIFEVCERNELSLS